MAVKPIPEGYHTVTPYLTVQGVAKPIDFLKHAVEAKEIHRMAQPDGTYHACRGQDPRLSCDALRHEMGGTYGQVV